MCGYMDIRWSIRDVKKWDAVNKIKRENYESFRGSEETPYYIKMNFFSKFQRYKDFIILSGTLYNENGYSLSNYGIRIL